VSDISKYLRASMLPHIWCPGCGHGIVTGAVMRAIDRAGLCQDKTVIVSGIGCSSRAPGYMDFDTLHTTHGRALAYATGVKLANPELNVVVITGDGDMAAIGGNHFIHACRRNIGICTVCFNNSTYGMTGGQYSPLTPKASYASTAPYGNIDRSFDICDLAKAAGATYVARATTYHIALLINLITKALQKKGFSLVEAVSQCPTYFGRRNRLGAGAKMMEWYRDNSVTREAYSRLGPEQRAQKIVIGEFHNVDEPEYTDEYAKVVEIAQKRREAR